MLADVICGHKMMSFMALDGLMSFLRLKDVTNTRKRMRSSLSIGGSCLLQWQIDFKCVFVVYYVLESK